VRKIEEPRLPFSDYPAREQEKDAERRAYLNKKYQPHAFILKVDGVYAHLIFSDGKPYHKFYDNKTLIDTYYAIRESYPQHKIKCIINKGLEDYLRLEREKEKAVNKLQRMIDFNHCR
jgi:hypothetical protein